MSSASSSSTNDSLDSSSQRQRRVSFAENLSTTFSRLAGRIGVPFSKPSQKKNDTAHSKKQKDQQDQEEDELILFECNICLDTASQPIVTYCGHLYCWPCIHKWMKTSSPASHTCPTCKSVISRDKMIPIYVRGRESKDPRDEKEEVPSRPAAQRTEPNVNGWRWPFTSFSGFEGFQFPRYGQDFEVSAGFGFGLFPGFGVSFTIPATLGENMNRANRNNNSINAQLEMYQQISNIISVVMFIVILFVLLY